MFNPTGLKPEAFDWQTPPGLRDFSASLPGSLVQLDSDTRLLLLANEDARDLAAFVGLTAMVHSGELESAFAPYAVALWLLFACRGKYLRMPLSGLRGSYRGPTPLAESVLGERGTAWKALFPERTHGYDPAACRAGLGRLLAGLTSTNAKQPTLPIGISALVDLPDWEPAYASSAQRLATVIGAHVLRWKRRDGGRPVQQPVHWLNNGLRRSNWPPLEATRQEVLWAVAFGMHFAWVRCYPKALRALATTVDPPLNDTEKQLFGWAHIDTNLMGIPIACFPRPHDELVRPILEKFFSGKITCNDARQQIQAVLDWHGLLKHDALEGDRERKSKRPSRLNRDIADPSGETIEERDAIIDQRLQHEQPLDD